LRRKIPLIVYAFSRVSVKVKPFQSTYVLLKERRRDIICFSMDDFSQIASYYDELYVKPEQYKAEAEKAMALIKTYKLSKGNELLDLACGTGGHIPYWLKHYRVTGLDISPEMLALAQKKFPDIKFIHSDMVDFSISQKFDALVCLYGSIGFVRTVKKLNKALITFARHMKPGGVLCLTPWSMQEEFKPSIHVDAVKHPDVKIARMESVRLKKPGIIVVDFHHLIGRDGVVKYHTQTMKIGLFARQQYLDAISGAGLELMEYYQGSDMHMGVFVARKPR
jgi:ubiquinone/menaquinone biosynthesis C-methylase UbiE